MIIVLGSRRICTWLVKATSDNTFTYSTFKESVNVGYVTQTGKHSTVTIVVLSREDHLCSGIRSINQILSPTKSSSWGYIQQDDVYKVPDIV